MSAISMLVPHSLDGLIARLADAFAWPAKVMEAREARALLAELSERERQDIGGAKYPGSDLPLAETSAERQARQRAIRAWYGHHAEAA